MPNSRERVTYESYDDIKKHHGLIIYCVYRIFDFLSKGTPTSMLFRLPHTTRKIYKYLKIHKFLDENVQKSIPEWQDYCVIFHVVITFFIVLLVWLIPSYNFNLFIQLLAVWFILGVVTYHARVLWLDDLKPGKRPDQLKVWSHRRILFQALINFVELIFLFTVFYHSFEPMLCFSQLLQASFEIATSLSRPDVLANSPSVLITTQVILSIFFLVVVINIVSSVGYRRRELAPPSYGDND